MGASQATGLGGAEAPEPPSRLGPTDAIPCAIMMPDEMRAEAEAFVRRCVVGIECTEEEIAKAAKAVFQGFTWHIDAIRRCGINGLFGPNPWEMRLIMDGGLKRGWQVFRDGKPIGGLFEEMADAKTAMEEFRADAIAMETRRAETTGSVAKP